MKPPLAKGSFPSTSLGVHKMGEVRVSLTNFIAIGLMAFIAVKAINYGLAAAALTQYKA